MKDRRKYWTQEYVAKRKGDIIDVEFSQSTPKKETEDTINRKAIQTDLVNLIKQGRSREEIFDYLWDKYKGTKQCMYISQWYEHHYARLKQNDTRKFEGR